MPNSRTVIGVVGGFLAVVSSIHTSAAQTNAGRRPTTNVSTAAAVIVPHESWSCGLPNGIPTPESGAPVFDITMTLERGADVGKTQYGRRFVAVARGGDVKGPRLAATVTAGALDFALTLANGVVEIEQQLVLLTNDGKYILV